MFSLRARQLAARMPGGFLFSGGGRGDGCGKPGSLRRFLPHLMRHWKIGALAGLVMLVSVALQLPTPLLTKYLIDTVVAQRRYRDLHLVGLWLFVFLWLQSGSTYLQVRLFSRFRCAVMFDLRSKLFKHMEKLPLRYFEQQRSGQIMSRLTADVNRVRGLMASNIISSLKEGLTLAFGVAVLFWLNWQLALLSIASLPFYIFWLLHWNPKVRGLGREVQQGYAVVAADVLESISGIHVIKSFLAEQAELVKMLASLRHLLDTEFRSDMVETLLAVGSGLISSLGKVAVIWISCWEIMQGRLTLGTFLAFNAYLRYLFDPSRNLVSLNSSVQQSLAALDRVYQLLDEQPEPDEGAAASTATAIRGRIEFRNVSFSYPRGEAEQISGVSFVVEAGSSVGLVGPSGSGKTTLLKLLLRFYEPQEGEIYLDGFNIQDLPLPWLRSQIAAVFQEPFLFSGDVQSNVLMGRTDARAEEMVECCRRAGAHEFITALPQGYATAVGERGVSLSGGQVQRLAIARALLKEAPVLIMDEATSSLDSTTERAFRAALTHQLHNVTTLMVAHRLNTVRHADRIVVLDRGRVAEIGRHDELMRLNGRYRRLYEDFSEEREDRGPAADPAYAIS
ncbi:MAG TPA: ABC transporter ATP-binding protein [Thermoanaerobaculia bacterium]|nr:ABC transporter ATP-binding protein [Thermoanaerobaculia bacterium]